MATNEHNHDNEEIKSFSRKFDEFVDLKMRAKARAKEGSFVNKECMDAIIEAHHYLVEVVIVDPKATWVTKQIKEQADNIREKLEKIDFVRKEFYGDENHELHNK